LLSVNYRVIEAKAKYLDIFHKNVNQGKAVIAVARELVFNFFLVGLQQVDVL